MGVPVIGPLLGDRLGSGFEGPFEVSVSIDQAAGSSVELEATVPDRQILDDSPAELEFSLRNVSENRLSLQTGVPEPFGVLRAGESGPLLWSSSYDDHGGVRIERGGRRIVVHDVGMAELLPPGERTSERYRLRSTDPRLQAGRFDVTAVNGGFPGQYASEVTAELRIESA